MWFVAFLESKGGREFANFALEKTTRVFLKTVSTLHIFTARLRKKIGDVEKARALFHFCKTEPVGVLDSADSQGEQVQKDLYQNQNYVQIAVTTSLHERLHMLLHMCPKKSLTELCSRGKRVLFIDKFVADVHQLRIAIMDKDIIVLQPSGFYSTESGWGFSITGHFLVDNNRDGYIVANSSTLSMNNLNLYMTAWISAFSLTYYCFHVVNGSYNGELVVGAIVSWIYPFHNLFHPVLASVFSGNGIVLKVSEHARWSGCFYVRILQSALATVGAPAHLVEVITGFAETRETLVSSVDKVIFVGSPGVGITTMRKAADTLIPVTLELGGKDPFIVCDDVDVPHVAQVAVRDALQSSGQNCAGYEKFYVHKNVFSSFVAAVVKIVKSVTAGPPRSGKYARCTISTDKKNLAIGVFIIGSEWVKNHPIKEKPLTIAKLTLVADNTRVPAAELQIYLAGLSRLGFDRIAARFLFNYYHTRITLGIRGCSLQKVFYMEFMFTLLLQVQYTLGSTFNVGDLSPYIDDDGISELRTIPFKGGGDDTDMGTEMVHGCSLTATHCGIDATQCCSLVCMGHVCGLGATHNSLDATQSRCSLAKCVCLVSWLI